MAKYSKSLKETVRENPHIECVYIEEKTGDHHFNHVREVRDLDKNKRPIGEAYLTVNDKKVIKVSREEILADDKTV